MNPTIPNRFSARFMDRINLINARVYVPQIQIRADMEAPLDPKRLARALRLLLDAEPICGCRFVEHWFKPYWERLTPRELDRTRLLETAPADGSGPEQDFLAAPMDFAKGPQVRALLLSHKGHDRLLIKVSHLAADAGGTKELFYRLADIYTRLGENPDYQPVPRLGSRSLWQVYRNVPLRQWPKLLFKAFADALPSLLPFVSQRLPMDPGESGPLVFVCKRIPPRRVARLHQYARERGATVNDLFVAAILRAVGEVCGEEGQGFPRLGGTVDLRKHIPGGQTGALCNVSGLIVANPRHTPGQNMDQALAAAKEEMDRFKSFWPGLSSLLFFRNFQPPGPYIVGKKLTHLFLGKITQTPNICPAMTNLGPIEPERSSFGGQKPVMAETFVPASVPPAFVMGLSGYGGGLTLSAGVYSGALPPETVSDLFDRIAAQVPK